jgi:hypothetical protein
MVRGVLVAAARSVGPDTSPRRNRR